MTISSFDIDAAMVHVKPATGHPLRLLKIVTGPEESSLARGLTLPSIQKLLGSFGRCIVEGCDRLVQEEHRRVELKTSDESDDLRLTAGEVAARFFEECPVPLEGSEEIDDLSPVESLPAMGLENEGLFEVLPDGSLEEYWSLVQIDNLFSIGRNGFTTKRPAFPLDAPLVVRVKERERSKKHRLPRTGRAGQGQPVARVNRDADTAQEPVYTPWFPSTKAAYPQQRLPPYHGDAS
jgi:hypothetical protein